MKIYNTLTKTKQEFEPVEKNKVLFYQCGPTVYWNQHIGNLRSVVLADFINRTFKYLGYEVLFARNYTDVGHLSGDNEGNADTGEDRMEKASKRENLNPEEIAQKYIQTYNKDVSLLNTIEPTFKPKATEYIEEQKEMINILFQKGFAYVTKLGIYFDVSKAENYHRLSGQKTDFNICGAGAGDVTDSEKKNKEDFALWFFKTGAHKNALQTWQFKEFNNYFENGQGFPGWHLECSAMAWKLLGDTIDIKMGGIEHIPIHHTNEIAQSENTTGKNYANFYLHNEHLLVDGKKMSKSEGTSYLLSDIIDKGYSPLDLRFLFLQAHYRSKQNFTWDSLEASKKAFDKIKNKLGQIESVGKINSEFQKKFLEKIEDDFNTPEALAVLHEVLKSDIPDQDKKATILDFDKIFGLKLSEVQKEKEEEMPQEVAQILEQRKQAREEKNWQKSDELRDKLAELGYIVKDGPDGQTVTKK
ncbi:cysteine--tRNA ligase [Candidatus Campbellbacteria bacterium]|nr:MAG: cysteine--tRNA ligase [Candidatus Campbellbacteria bacterium]